MNKNNLKILYVDDSNFILSYVKILFGEYGFSNVTYANDGYEAFKLYKESSGFDIVFTDVFMPVMDGFELIENIKSINDQQLVVMVTAMEKKQDLIRAIELEVKYFIEKPINPKKFFKTLDSAIKLANLKNEYELSNKLLNQYKQAIDKTTILTKTDLDGNITYVNDQFLNITGFSSDTVIGQSCNSLVCDEKEIDSYRSIWEVLKTKTVWKGIVKNQKKDGSIFIADTTAIPILDTDNNVIEYIWIRHDITESEMYKDYLKNELDGTNVILEANKNLRKQYQKSLDETTAILRTDKENIIKYVNENFCKISGYSKDELIGKDCSTLRDESHIINKDCVILKEKLNNRETVKIIFKNISKDGTPFYTDTAIYAIIDIHDNIVEYMHIMHDITEIIELNHEIEETQKEVVFTMGAIGETRSKETGNHVKRVAEYSYLLAKLHGMDEEEAELIKMASPMHDIGKVGIPDSILNKPGILTDEEFNIMKTHAKLGYNLLKGSNREILKASSTIALEHHERWNGDGYPNKKAGEDIHIYGRITSICDVFDALGSDRVYKKAWSLERILDLFKEEKGKQFDPKLMDLFLDNLDKFLVIRDKYKDV